MPLQWQRYGIVGTTPPPDAPERKTRKKRDMPELLNVVGADSADEASRQCKRYSQQGWGCQVMRLKITAELGAEDQG